ncbi:MAG: hypothetical protein ACRDD8_08210 [Bacteroidales bacterium]
MIYSLKLHSIIDVITNSSTEIFKAATDSGVESINNLLKAQIETFNLDLKPSDIVKCILISSDNQEIMASVYLFYKALILKNDEQLTKSVIAILPTVENGNASVSDYYATEEQLLSMNSISDLDTYIARLFNNQDTDFLFYQTDFSGQRSHYFDMGVELYSSDTEFATLHDNIIKYFVSNGEDNDYPHETQYYIVPTSEKYEKLVESICDTLDIYSHEARYC